MTNEQLMQCEDFLYDAIARRAGLNEREADVTGTECGLHFPTVQRDLIALNGERAALYREIADWRGPYVNSQ